MTAVFCRNAADRKAETWEKQLEPFSSLEFAVSDAAKGIAKAVAEVSESRRGDLSAAALGHGLDVFHTTMEARRVEQRLRSPAPTSLPAADPAPPAALLDETTRRRLAVTAFALGISTRQIEELFRAILPDAAPDHSTIGRWVAHEAEKVQPVLPVLDAAAAPRIQTLARDASFLGGGRLGSASNL